MKNKLNEVAIEWANETIQMIRDVLEQKNINASGSLSDSLRSDVNIVHSSIIIWAKEHAIWTDRGRGPTKNTGNGELLEKIKQWLEHKKLNLNPYAITKNIHEYGTKAHREGTNRKVFDNVNFWDERIKKLTHMLQTTYLKEINNITSDLFKK